MGSGKPGRRKSSVCEWRSGKGYRGLVGHKQPVGLHLQACVRPLGCPVWEGDGAELDE